jgi:hypothetical protein
VHNPCAYPLEFEGEASSTAVGKTKDNLKACMFKQGTVLWDSVVKGTNKLKKFVTAEQCNDSINIMYGIKGLSGRELQKAVKEGRVGVSLPHHGRPSKIPDDDFKLLSQLFFTLSATEQSNTDPQRMTRPKLVALAGIIVNDKLIFDGSAKMCDVPFFKPYSEVVGMEDVSIYTGVYTL